MKIAYFLAVIVLKEVEGAPEQLQYLSDFHLLADGLLLLLLFFFFFNLKGKYREVNQYLWEEEPTGSAQSSWKPLLAYSGGAMLLLLLLPELMNLSWKQMAAWQPYLVYILLLVLLLSFFSGIFLAYVRFAHRQKLKIKENATAD